MSDFPNVVVFSGNLNLLKNNIGGWLICGEWIDCRCCSKEGDHSFIRICKFGTKKGGSLWNYLIIGKGIT
jgi:hypothetical protein